MSYANDLNIIKNIVNETILTLNPVIQENVIKNGNRNAIEIAKADLQNYIDSGKYYDYSSGLKNYLVGGNTIINEQALFVLYYLSGEYDNAKKILLDNDFNVNFLICKDEDFIHHCGNYYFSEEEMKKVNDKFKTYRFRLLFYMFLEEKDFNFLNILIKHPTFDSTFSENTLSPLAYVINVQKQTSTTNILRNYIEKSVKQFQNNILYNYDSNYNLNFNN